MLYQCPASCGTCAAVAKPSFRERAACAGLARNGACGVEDQKAFMFKTCPISCQVVDEPCEHRTRKRKRGGRRAPPPRRRGGHDET